MRKSRKSGNFVHSRPAAVVNNLLSRERLIRRWQCGSDSSFYRAERSQSLVPRQFGGVLGYTWPDVWAYEGGQPPEGRERDWQRDLLTPEEVAARCILAPSTILKLARRGVLPSRRIGYAHRFVEAEVDAWVASWPRRGQ